MSLSTFASLDEARKEIAYRKVAERVRDIKDVVPTELEKILAEVKRRESIIDLRSSVPPIFQDFFQPARYKGAWGGRGSGKSQSFGHLVIDKAITKKGARIVCVREVQKSLEQSVKRLLEDLIQRHNLGQSFRVLNTHIVTPDDGVIIFQGMQNHTAESIKSLEGFDVAWVEEAQSLSQNSLEMLRPTIRKEYPDGTSSEIWFTWNPKDKKDPVDKFLRGDVLPPDALVKRVCYPDNPFLPEVLKKEMEWDRSRDTEKYSHVWLGEYERHSDSRVFKNWKIEEFDAPPEDTLFYYGADWGFSVDPSVLVRCFVVGRKLFIDYEAYEVGVEIDHLPALFDQVPGAREWAITADSARPETISYLQRNGFPRLTAAVKGKDSVKEGVIFLQNYDIIVHPRNQHTIYELTHYSFKVDQQTQIVSPVLEDKKNHVIDSLRYAVEPIRKPVADDFLTW